MCEYVNGADFKSPKVEFFIQKQTKSHGYYYKNTFFFFFNIYVKAFKREEIQKEVNAIR
jgi:hypothetical protein